MSAHSIEDEEEKDEGEETHPFVAKWQGKALDLSVPLSWSVRELRQYLSLLTTVEFKNVKVMGLKVAGGKAATDGHLLRDVAGLKRPQAFVMMGTPQQLIDAGPPEDLAALCEDGGAGREDDEGEGRSEAQHDETNLAKIRQRLKSYRAKEVHPSRAGKRALVLDIDYTFFDCGSPTEDVKQLARPYLHEMLALVYAHYDIVIWSATSMKWIEAKLMELGMFTHPDYRITLLLGILIYFILKNKTKQNY